MKLKTLLGNGLVAVLYIAISAVIQPIGFTNIQFRIPEMFNHLIVFNKRYFFGILLGVFLTNLFSPLGLYDLIFGVGHSVSAMLITILSMRFIKSIKARMIFNTFVFTFLMFLIAIELNLALGLPFLFSWLTTAIGEFVVMMVGIPVMLGINKRVNFKERV